MPHGNWKTITFIAALRHDRITAPFVLEGPMTGEMFKAYIEQVLAPTLTRGDVVFMDNVGIHKVDGIEEAIEARGALPGFISPHDAPHISQIQDMVNLNGERSKRAKSGMMPDQITAEIAPIEGAPLQYSCTSTATAIGEACGAFAFLNNGG